MATSEQFIGVVYCIYLFHTLQRGSVVDWRRSRVLSPAQRGESPYEVQKTCGRGSTIFDGCSGSNDTGIGLLDIGRYSPVLGGICIGQYFFRL